MYNDTYTFCTVFQRLEERHVVRVPARQHHAAGQLLSGSKPQVVRSFPVDPPTTSVHAVRKFPVHVQVAHRPVEHTARHGTEVGTARAAGPGGHPKAEPAGRERV